MQEKKYFKNNHTFEIKTLKSYIIINNKTKGGWNTVISKFKFYTSSHIRKKNIISDFHWNKY